MVTRLELSDALYEDLANVLTNSDHASVSDATDHVGLLNRHDRSTYPYIGIERFGDGDRVSNGIGGSFRKVSETTDAQGNVDQVTTKRRESVTISFAAIADDSDYRSSSKLLNDVKRHFDDYVDDTVPLEPSDLHEDVRTISFTGDSDGSRPDDGVVGQRVSYVIEYGRYRTRDVDAIEDISLTVQSEGSEALQQNT